MSGLVFAATFTTTTDGKLNLPAGATQVKGSGNSDNGIDKWSPIFATDSNTKGVKYWHFVDSGTNANQDPIANEMVLLFEDGNGVFHKFEWLAGDGFSRNPGDNNPGWVLRTPIDWKLVDGYLNKALNQFNLSGTKAVPGDPPPPELYGELELEKTVGGVAIKLWAFDVFGENDDAVAKYYGYVDFDELWADLISGVKFHIYAAAYIGDNPVATPTGSILRTGGLNDYGQISGFLPVDPLAAGWYVVVEEFVAGSLAESIFDQVGPLLIYVNDNNEFVGSGDSTFDYDAFYTIVNGYNWEGRRTLGYPGLNNNGDLFYIGVRNAETGQEYGSFCANSGSRAFAGESNMGCAGYYQGEAWDKENNQMDLEDYLAALNYLEDNYGPLNDNRAITQVVIWALLGSVDVDSALFAATNLSADEKAAVTDVVKNHAGYQGKGTIVDVVFMTCENHHDYADCQPQLVPLYGGGGFDNTYIPGSFYSAVSFQKLVQLAGEDDPMPADFWNAEFKDDPAWFGIAFDLYKFNPEAVAPADPWELALDADDVYLGPYEPKDFGVVTVEKLVPGEYKFVETNLDLAKWKLFLGDLEVDALYFTIPDEKDATAIWRDFDNDSPDDPVLINKEIPGKLKITTSAGKWYELKDSITGGYSEEGVNARGAQTHNLSNKFVQDTPKNDNPGKGNDKKNNEPDKDKPNGNSGSNSSGNGNGGNGPWFQFNQLTDDKKIGENTWKFDLVNGDKLKKVGVYTITKNSDNSFTLKAYYDDDMQYPLAFVGAKVTIANKIEFAQNKNQANPNTIWTHAPGQQQFSGSGHEFKTKALGAPFDASKDIFVYLHLDGLKGLVDFGDIVDGYKYKVVVTGPSFPAGEEFELVMNAGTKAFTGELGISDLRPGAYTVEVYKPGATDVFKTLAGNVTANGTLNLSF